MYIYELERATNEIIQTDSWGKKESRDDQHVCTIDKCSTKNKGRTTACCKKTNRRAGGAEGRSRSEGGERELDKKQGEHEQKRKEHEQQQQEQPGEEGEAAAGEERRT